MALSATASTVVQNVRTQGIGFAPILRHYFEKCAIAEIIDENVVTDPRRKVLTHGQAAVAMITGILFQVMQLYRIRQLADQSTVLDVIFPGIKPEAYFDDRLADTLDALYHHGIGDLELELTRHMIDTFKVSTDVCHNCDHLCRAVASSHRPSGSQGLSLCGRLQADQQTKYGRYLR